MSRLLARTAILAASAIAIGGCSGRGLPQRPGGAVGQETPTLAPGGKAGLIISGTSHTVVQIYDVVDSKWTVAVSLDFQSRAYACWSDRSEAWVARNGGLERFQRGTEGWKVSTLAVDVKDRPKCIGKAVGLLGKRPASEPPYIACDKPGLEDGPIQCISLVGRGRGDRPVIGRPSRVRSGRHAGIRFVSNRYPPSADSYQSATTPSSCRP
jgi:hypothetical protein